MAVTARERVARLLDDDDTPGAFSTRFTMEPDAVALAVEGAGPVSLPVSGPVAKKLIKAARPARFGLGEQTLTDLSVRDTWEISPAQLKLTGLDWDAIFTEVRDAAAEQAGCEAVLALTEIKQTWEGRPCRDCDISSRSDRGGHAGWQRACRLSRLG